MKVVDIVVFVVEIAVAVRFVVFAVHAVAVDDDVEALIQAD